MDDFSFRDLIAYKKARNLVKDVYSLAVRRFPMEEKYGLGDQVRRAVVSVPSNIAEGMSRHSHKEQVHFLEIAYGSLMEVLCQLELASDLQYITIETLAYLEKEITEVAKLISGLRTSIVKKNSD